MGWFLWGIALGWAACALLYAVQEDGNKSNNGAIVICVALIIIASIISINLGVVSGAIPVSPTPTSLGR